MYDVLTFNGVSFADYGTFYDSSQIFITPEKQTEFFEIPGRSGDLSISQNRFANVSIPYNCFIRRNFIENYTNLMNYLLSQDGYGRLENTREADVYRMAQFVSETQPDTGAFLKYGSFTLTFNCKPQKWLKSGENAIYVDSSVTLMNPTQFDAKPLIEVTGTGTITINNTPMVLDTNTSVTYIDCDMQDAYEGTINRNPNLTVSSGFPVLSPGENVVTVNGCTINIIPRWWRL